MTTTTRDASVSAASSADLIHPVAVRSWVLPVRDGGAPKGRRSSKPEAVPWQRDWPGLALVFDCETRVDEAQNLMVGFYRVLEGDRLIQEGIFTDEREADRYSLIERRALNEFCVAHPGIKRHTRASFVEQVFYPIAFKGHAVVVGFNLPFDLSRLAVRVHLSRIKGTDKTRKRFTFTLVDHVDGRGRHTSPVGTPRVAIDPGMGRGAGFRFVDKYVRNHGRFVDLMVLVAALTGKALNLERACDAYHTPHQKAAHPAFGRVTSELLDYARQDVAATADLYLRVLADYARHPIPTPLDKVYSSASVGKGYLRAMGVRVPRLVVDDAVPMPVDAVHGIAASAYFGARAECRIRRTPVPVSYVDFRSMYPTVNALMGLWSFVTAGEVVAREATVDTLAFLDAFQSEDLFNPETWRRLPVLVELMPDGEPLIHRVKLRDNAYSAYTLSVGPLKAYEPVWYTLADVLVAVLRGGKAPTIRRAIRFDPGPAQSGLRPVVPPDMRAIDPARDDFFRYWIAERGKVKRSETPYADLDEAEGDALQQFMKVMANATSYGIYMEMNRHEGEPATVRGYGVREFSRDVDSFEEPGAFCFPAVAAFITAGARLMLGLAEWCVLQAGGQFATMDTDSLTVVATPAGGLVPCPGGPERLPDGTAAIRALAYAQVDTIGCRFLPLNPYGDGRDILELEQENFDPNTSERRQLFCYAVASKRYCLYDLDAWGQPRISKASEHGLGAYRQPDQEPDPHDAAADEPGGVPRRRKWQVEAWRWLLCRELDISCERPAWFGLPVLSQLTIETPAWLRWFDPWNTAVTRRGKGGKPHPLPYEQRVKPFNFLLHPLHPTSPRHALAGTALDAWERAAKAGAGPAGFSLVAPFTERPREFRNRHDPNGPNYRAELDVSLTPYSTMLERYGRHAERKLLGPDSQPCRPYTRGLLRDRTTVASRFVQVGKEAADLEARLAHLESDDENVTTYDDPRWDRLAAVLRDIGTATVATTFAITYRTVERWIDGTRRPEHPAAVVAYAATHARDRLPALAYAVPADEWDAVAVYGAYLRQQQAGAADRSRSRDVLRDARREFVAAVHAVTAGKRTRPGSADTLTEWRTHVPRCLRPPRRDRVAAVPVDEVAAGLASAYPHLGITSEDDFYRMCRRLWT